MAEEPVNLKKDQQKLSNLKTREKKHMINGASEIYGTTSKYLTYT